MSCTAATALFKKHYVANINLLSKSELMENIKELYYA